LSWPIPSPPQYQGPSATPAQQVLFSKRFGRWGSSPVAIEPLPPSDDLTSFDNRFGDWRSSPAGANRSAVLRELQRYERSDFEGGPAPTSAQKAPAETPIFQTDNASTIGGVGKFIGDEATSSMPEGLPSRMVSSSFPGLTPGNPKQPSSPQQSAPLLGVFSNKPMSPSPLGASLWGLRDNCEASDEGNWFTRLGGAGPENPNQPTATRLDELLRAIYC
jgi:hypothetical protein